MSGRLCEVYSLGALLLSQLVWSFMDAQMYNACAFGGEYTILFDVDDWSFPIALLSACGLAIAGLSFAVRAAFLKPRRELYVLLLVATNLYICWLGWFELGYTAMTTDGPG